MAYAVFKINRKDTHPGFGNDSNWFQDSFSWSVFSCSTSRPQQLPTTIGAPLYVAICACLWEKLLSGIAISSNAIKPSNLKCSTEEFRADGVQIIETYVWHVCSSDSEKQSNIWFWILAWQVPSKSKGSVDTRPSPQPRILLIWRGSCRPPNTNISPLNDVEHDP